jgi:hypothetical protein
MYYTLPVKERIELMKKYKTAYPGMSYNDMVEHFNTVQEYGNGGLIGDGDKELTPQQRYAPTPILNMTPQMQQMAFTPTTQKEVGDWVKRHGRGNVDEAVNPIDFIVGGEATAIAKAINPRYLRTAKTIDKIDKAGNIYETGETAYNVSKYKQSFKPMVGEINNMHKRPDIDISDVAEKVRDNYVKTKNTGKIKYDYTTHNPIPNTTQEDILRSYELSNYNKPVIKQNLGWKPLNK